MKKILLFSLMFIFLNTFHGTFAGPLGSLITKVEDSVKDSFVRHPIITTVACGGGIITGLVGITLWKMLNQDGRKK
jgi:hypothetical protein